jgi:hypothetical protein
MPVHTLSIQRILNVVQRATQTAAQANLAALLDRTLDLFVEEARAEAGTLYLYDPERDELVFHVVKGDETSQRLLGMRIPANVAWRERRCAPVNRSLSAMLPAIRAGIAASANWHPSACAPCIAFR